jgi:hypothetical protein
MYANLYDALKRKGISLKKYAEFLGVTEKTVQNKIQGQTEFTLSEVDRTLNFIFPEYTLSYLFKKDDDSSSQKGA